MGLSDAHSPAPKAGDISNILYAKKEYQQERKNLLIPDMTVHETYLGRNAPDITGSLNLPTHLFNDSMSLQIEIFICNSPCSLSIHAPHDNGVRNMVSYLKILCHALHADGHDLALISLPRSDLYGFH